MKIMTFRGATLQEALRQVREQLGPEASVLHVRELEEGQDAAALGSRKSGRRRGVHAKNKAEKMVEVDASRDIHVESHFRRSNSAPQRDSIGVQASVGLAESVGFAEGPHEPPSLGQANTSNLLSSLPPDGGFRPDFTVGAFPDLDSVNAPQSIPYIQPGRSDAPFGEVETSEKLYAQLIQNGFESQLAMHLLAQATSLCTLAQRQDFATMRLCLLQQIAKNLRTSPPFHLDREEPQILAFVGPTGSGKTTTLCKLATRIQSESPCRIGLIGTDFVRYGAVDQLLSFAEKSSAILEVVSSPSQIGPALTRLRDCDVVLLDTPGRSLRDSKSLQLIGEFLEASHPDGTHLVLSANSSARFAAECCFRFSDLQPTSLILTKLDECVDLGSWYSQLAESPFPVSYLGRGQNLGQEILDATPRILASNMLQNGDDHASVAMMPPPSSTASKLN